MPPIDGRTDERVSDVHAAADEAVACVRSGMNVFVHGAAATPTAL